MPDVPPIFVAAEPRRRLVRLPRWGWFLFVTMVVITASALSTLPVSIARIDRQNQLPYFDDSEVTYLSQASVGKKRWLTKYDGTEHSRQLKTVDVPSNDKDFERLIQALVPIRFNARAAFVKPEYQIAILNGKNGVLIQVGQTSGENSDEILVKYYGRHYSGGKPDEFKAIAETILRDSN